MARPKRTTPWLGARDNGTFYAHWYDEADRQTKRLSLRTADSAEAEARFAEFLLKGRELRSSRRTGKEITVYQALDDYLEEHVDNHCAARERQHGIVIHLKAFFDERTTLADIDVPSSREYAQARINGVIGGGKRRKSKAASPATVRRELNVLVAAANHAVWMKRPGAVTIQVDLPPETRLGQDDEAPYYTRDELGKVLDSAARSSEEMGLFMRLLYQTGARRRSIENLTRSQIRLPQRRILLQQPGKRTTKKRQPIVPILNSMLPDVQRLLDVGGEHRLFACSDFYRPYRSICESAGIDEGRRHPHVMRHTRATHLLQDGKSIYDVAKLLGDTLATVERVYGHHSHDHLARALED